MPSATTPSTQPDDARMADQGHLVLLVLAVTLVDAGRGGESVAFAHGVPATKRQPRPGARIIVGHGQLFLRGRQLFPWNSNLHSPERRLIELRIEHADLDALIDAAAHAAPLDELLVRRLKKRRLQLRDQIARLELALDPKEPA